MMGVSHFDDVVVAAFAGAALVGAAFLAAFFGAAFLAAFLGAAFLATFLAGFLAGFFDFLAAMRSLASTRAYERGSGRKIKALLAERPALARPRAGCRPPSASTDRGSSGRPTTRSESTPLDFHPNPNPYAPL